MRGETLNDDDEREGANDGEEGRHTRKERRKQRYANVLLESDYYFLFI